MSNWNEEIIQTISDDETKPFIQPEQLAQIMAFAISNYHPSLPSNLDEAAEKFAVLYDQGTCDGIAQDCFKAGAEWMAGQGVSLSHLIAWYIQSVDAHEPVWTKEHLEELVKDYILIPKK